MLLKRIKEHTILSKFLNENAIVVDLGANIGCFASEITDAFHCRCYSVEANPQCFQQIPQNDRLQAFNLAVSAKSGTLDFFIAENPESSSLNGHVGTYKDKISVPTQRLVDLVHSWNLPRIDLLKFDIEGAEIEVLDDCGDDFLMGIAQISVEFHDFNNMVSRQDVARVVRRLNSLGFAHIHHTSTSVGHADTLFINKALCSVGTLDILWGRHILRNYLGLKRVLKRRLRSAK